jgi:uncharacterized membrane protein
LTGLPLTTISTQGLEIVSNPRDLLRDLFTFIEYLCGREVKRMVRTNELSKADSVRIAKLMGDPEMEQAVQETGGAAWIDFIDGLALILGLVDYDTQGEYRGYSSSSPSYVDNYITVVEKAYQKFLDLSPVEQELKILETLIVQRKRTDFDSSNNEFYRQSVLGRLDGFSIRGSAMGVMPTLDFTAIRRFLLKLVQKCERGVWYSTASLVAYLKASHPFFLIPERIPSDRYGRANERYYNFHDGPEQWGRDDSFVPADAPNAFERVEGRYIERFLEGFPLTMRFVELAYKPAPKQKVYPSLGFLPAFRVTERFLRLMKDEIQSPRLTVQPNFDIILESEIYPARLLQTLTALAEEISAPAGNAHASVVTLQLKKERIAAALVRDPGLDVVALLRRLSGRDLPPNVSTELEEWSGHAEQFVLYEGFGLLESAAPLPQTEAYKVERLSPAFCLVRHTDVLVNMLEVIGLAPLRVEHGAAHFELLSDTTHSVFPKKSAAPALQRGPELVFLRRSSLVTLDFSSSPQAFEDFRKALAEARCPIQANAATFTITFSSQRQPQFNEVQRQLADKYQVEIQDSNG